jgi:serine/threonine-protein kinase
LTGQTLGDFRIQRRLGEGGMGQVYLAEQVSLKRPVALKILKADLAEHPKALARFKTEAEAIARAVHPNIVQVYAIGEQDGLHFMALEYVDGFNLRDYLTKKGTPTLALALSIMRQGAAALQCAGELGIIHRDIKPDNILMTRKGVVKIADFGLSRFAGDQPRLNLTQSGLAMGTPLYMSPEQVEGKPLDSRTDTYSFGVTCYHMLAGQPPFRGQTAFEVALQHVQAEPEHLERIRPDLPPELCAIVHKMMAKQPDQRYATAREILKDLARLRPGLTTELAVQGMSSLPVDASASDLMATVNTSIVATRPRLGTLGNLGSRLGLDRHRLGLALVVLVLALIGGGWAGWRSQPPASPPPESTKATVPAEAWNLERRRELLVLAVKEEYANPQDAQQVNVGLGYCLDLATLYLEQWRLDEAEQFFQELIDNPYRVKEYTTLGKLGRAVVRAFPRDNPTLGERYQESTQEFLDLVTRKEPGLPRLNPIINRHKAFLRWMVKALDYNAANLGPAFPAELQEYRRTRPWPQKKPSDPAKPAGRPSQKV